MKKLFFTAFAFVITISLSAQGNKGGKGKNKENPVVTSTETPDEPAQKGKSKNKDKQKGKQDQNDKDEKGKNQEHDKKVWEGVAGSEGCGLPSKNQPAKVRSSFQRDYPNAVNVRWTKCRGDWTATFSGGLFHSTAVYHANGERRDTRTPITRKEIPGITLDSILKKRPGINIGDVIKIDLPNKAEEIFRIKSGTDTGPEFLFFNKLGDLIKYDY
jgi:hypothetical protein